MGRGGRTRFVDAIGPPALSAERPHTLRVMRSGGDALNVSDARVVAAVRFGDVGERWARSCAP